MKGLLDRLYDRQHRFWTAPTTGASAALFRIALGLLCVPTAFELLVNRERWFADDGTLPWSVAVARNEYIRFSLIGLAPHSHGLLLVLGVAMLVAAVTLTLGIASRASAFVAWACMLAFATRNPYIMNGGDRLFTLLLLVAIVMPLSRKWSLEAGWRRTEERLPSVWSIRLVQLQVAWMYAMTGFAKLAQPGWQHGHMMRDVLASPVYCEVPVMIGWAAVPLVMGWGVLLFECGFPFAIWWRRTRPIWLAAGVAMHLGIELLMVIPLFSAATFVSYIPFLTDAEAERFVAWLRARSRGGSRGRSATSPAAPT